MRSVAAASLSRRPQTAATREPVRRPGVQRVPAPRVLAEQRRAREVRGALTDVARRGQAEVARVRPQGARRDGPPVHVRDAAARARAALLLLGRFSFLAAVLRRRFCGRRRRGQALAAPQRRELHRRRHERERRHSYTTHEHAPHLVGRVGAQPDAALARGLTRVVLLRLRRAGVLGLAAFFCCAWNLSNSSRSSDFISMRVGSRRSIAVISETAAAAKRLDCGGLLLAAEDACTRTAPFFGFAAPAAR